VQAQTESNGARVAGRSAGAAAVVNKRKVEGAGAAEAAGALKSAGVSGVRAGSAGEGERPGGPPPANAVKQGVPAPRGAPPALPIPIVTFTI
jgi:hypothetical protein